ncbi:MAG TPA: PilZ domain-containing protein [bacterium]|nr:PilZ domain-containing protein [bacterium]
MKIFKDIRIAFFSRVADKRKYPRVPFSVKVTNHNSGNFSYYQATNISIGGMFLKADEPLPIGATLDLRFSLPTPDNRDLDIQVQAQVVRVQSPSPQDTFPSGMGVKFLSLPREAKKTIKAFIRRRM